MPEPPESPDRPETDSPLHDERYAVLSETPGYGRDVSRIKTTAPWLRPLKPSVLIFFGLLLTGLLVGRYVTPTWSVQKIGLDTYTNDAGEVVFSQSDDEVLVADPVPIAEATLTAESLNASARNDEQIDTLRQFVYEDQTTEAGETARRYAELTAKNHWGYWSLLPAVAAIALCVITREPMTALLGGIVCAAFMLGRFDITDEVLLPNLQKDGVADVLLLYCGLLGGLMGIWSRTGSARAFADWMTRAFVQGPRTAKLVGWGLGVTFFQGATISSIMVGSTVKPVADRENVSHEELSYIVDSTASPIAAVLAFNGWPLYVQALIFVPGVTYLATVESRIGFFFESIVFSFYGIFAVLGTFLLCIEKAPFIGRRMREAIRRSRETGQLDAPGAAPLQAKELEEDEVPEGYTPTLWGFVVPMAVLIGTVITTFVISGSPNTNWAFGGAFLAAVAIALLRGLSLAELVDGMATGMKSVVVAALILVLAMTIGDMSTAVGGQVFLVEKLGDAVPYWILPIALVAMTMLISFSTGTSWGTYAVAFPLGMPLAWELAQVQGLEHPKLYMMICFATILNGSLYGDQCSPISDTTVLSSMVTGADLMDHVRTQIIPASIAMLLAMICWTAIVLIAV